MSTRSFAAVCALALWAGACTDRSRSDKAAAKRGVVTVVFESQASWVENFNPFAQSSRWPTAAGIYEPLLVFNTMKGDYERWLAEDYGFSEDKKKLSFTLRRGVRWSDGAPFTAEDVAYTFNLLKQKPALDRGGAWTYLERVEVIDDHHVDFHFNRPKVTGLSSVGHAPIVPEHVWKNVKDPVKFINEKPIGTGPFTEVTLFQNQVYELGKNPNYWQEGKPYVDGVRCPAFPGNEQSTLALITGEVDWGGLFVPAIDRVYVARDPEHFHYWFPLVSGTAMLYANTTRAPFDDVRVRKALSMALDRKLMVKVASYDYTRPSDDTGLSDAFAKWRSLKVDPRKSWVRHDPDRANALLDDAGWRRGSDGARTGPDGAPLEYEVDVVTGWAGWVRAAQIIVAGLDEIGIRAKVKPFSFGAWYSQLQRGEFDLAISWSPTAPTPYEFYRHMMAAESIKPVGETSDRNWHRLEVDGVDELLHAFDRTSEEAQQKKIVHRLQEMFVEHAPAIPLFPNPSWGEFNDEYFTGFPNGDDPYAKLAPFGAPEYIIALTEIRPR